MIPLHHSVEFQHHLWLDALVTARTIVDITCGNGHDTVYLLSHCHKNSHVYAIDTRSSTNKDERKAFERVSTGYKTSGFHIGVT